MVPAHHTAIKYILLSFTFLIFFLLLTKNTFAVTLTINNSPATISSDPFNLDIYLEGPNPSINYLRIDIYKEGTTNYFGETFNGTGWYSGSVGNQYFPITISPESTASATLQGKLGNPSSTEYSGPGQYKLRIRRYTSSGSQSSGDQQIPVSININVETPSPTPTQVPSTTPTKEPTSTPKPTATTKPSPTNTPTSIPTSTPKPKIIPTLIPTITNGPKTALITSQVLGIENPIVSPTPTSTLEKNPKKESKTKFPFLAGALLILGGIFTLVGAGPYLKGIFTQDP